MNKSRQKFDLQLFFNKIDPFTALAFDHRNEERN